MLELEDKHDFPREVYSRHWADDEDPGGNCGIQGSVCVSAKLMSSAETARILGNLVKKNPWLNLCMRDCRESNIGKEYSLSEPQFLHHIAARLHFLRRWKKLGKKYQKKIDISYIMEYNNKYRRGVEQSGSSSGS